MAGNLRYVPEFEIRIAGEDLPAAMRASVSSVRYQDGIEGADRVEISLVNENLRWFGSRLLKPGNELSLWLGYVGELKTMFVGEITGVEAAFPSSGVPTLTVTAHDFLHKLTRGNVQRDWRLPDVAIAGAIAAKHGLRAEGEGAALIAALISIIEFLLGHERRQSASDFDFLSQIARDHGLDMYIDPRDPHGRILRFSGLDLGDAPRGPTLRWGESLIEFTPRVSTVGQVNAVAIRVSIQEFGIEFVIAVGMDFDRGELVVSIVPILQSVASSLAGSLLSGISGAGPLAGVAGSFAAAGVGQAFREMGLDGGSGDTWTMLDDVVANPATAVRLVMAELTRRLNQRLTGSGSAVGDPDIRAGTVIHIDGLGKSRFNGPYRVTSASHTIDGGGYRTGFEVRGTWIGGIL